MISQNQQKVLEVHHWTDTLFSFKTTRDSSFRYVNGQFTMIGLEIEGKPVLRAYSMVSANYEETLEFLSIKVEHGLLTSRLRHLKPGDSVIIGRKATGTLIVDNLLPGKNLYLLSTGTGLAPFMSIIRDPEIYECYEKIILTHTCRFVDELAYRNLITEDLSEDEYLGEFVRNKLIYYPTITREDFKNQGRITELIQTNKFFVDIDLPPFSKEDDRIMICGSPEMLKEMSILLEKNAFIEGHNHTPGHYLVERAFVA
ncbi:ferredoxin--NADP reductase [Candidatus Pandoraea novymonadis]|uniref:ferredoxin--NADP(+) reductase n=1 Tax=Candidatus Pandoraea novymonadis TaxID=1808959 RepID=A0ABX5FG57_9BURK|nr:ferredoxin--NADP reductase [Candidatus Pandoraea novymonadis]PSB92107.1 Ferredoxin--NADP reductase [Candidatus Pandoraea novymonadis]